MGTIGRISRILAPFVGSFMTFCSLEQGEESAHGQISAQEMRRIWNIISP
jgi:3-dehydroquinate dehydratase